MFSAFKVGHISNTHLALEHILLAYGLERCYGLIHTNKKNTRAFLFRDERACSSHSRISFPVHPPTTHRVLITVS